VNWRSDTRPDVDPPLAEAEIGVSLATLEMVVVPVTLIGFEPTFVPDPQPAAATPTTARTRKAFGFTSPLYAADGLDVTADAARGHSGALAQASGAALSPLAILGPHFGEVSGSSSVTGSSLARLTGVGGSETEAERAALRRLRRDPDAICVIYDRYVLQLVRFLQTEGASPEIAWDAAQETFARLLAGSRRRSIQTPVAAWPWLTTTGKNLLRDWSRRGTVDSRARARLGISSQHLAAAEIDDLVARLDAHEAGGRLSTALDALATEQRQAIVNRVIGGLDYPEVAALAGVSEETVRTRVSRGLRRMRSLLLEEGS
jgi:RNA polymerase sigma-70 factor (ECF subfamily)